MMIYLVNQKHYEVDKESSCLCAPKRGHKNMKKIRKGDFFLNNVGSNMIKAISIAKDDCHELDSPENFSSPPQGWEKGEHVYQVPVNYYEFSSPIRFNGKHGQGYVQKINPNLIRNILEKSLKQNQSLEMQNIVKETLEMAKSKTDNDDTDYVNLVKSAKNVIFHGAPGTGKTYLAKQIAAKIVSNNKYEYSELPPDLKNRIGFIQFYPGYDYSNFVEGFRPQPSGSSTNGEMNFKLQPGIFKGFIDNIIKINEEFARKYLTGCEFKTNAGTSKPKGNPFKVKEINEEGRIIFDGSNSPSNKKVTLDVLLKGPRESSGVYDYNDVGLQQRSYYLPMWNYLKEKKKEEEYVFIIDEINRGNTSSIFGELFYAIDPNNRGKEGEVTLQYSGDKFYIPENVWLIGTMNDIDRSVEPFDFAFRRRWIFKLIEPVNTQDGILSTFNDDPLKTDIEIHMNNLNYKIRHTDGLGDDYQIGAAYFLKLKDLGNDFNKLWKDSLEPLLKEYVYGMDNEDLLPIFKEAYEYHGRLQEQD